MGLTDSAGACVTGCCGVHAFMSSTLTYPGNPVAPSTPDSLPPAESCDDPTLLERDTRVPSFTELAAEAARAEQLMESAHD